MPQLLHLLSHHQGFKDVVGELMGVVTLGEGEAFG